MKNTYPFMSMMAVCACMNAATMALTFAAWYMDGFDMLGVGLLMMVGASSYGQASAYLDWKKAQRESDDFRLARASMMKNT